MHPIDCTDDFSYALFFISPKMFDDLRFHTFSHDYEKFNYAPVCSLTDDQAAHLLDIVDQLIIIANHTDEEMPHRYQTLLAQLAVGYEFPPSNTAKNAAHKKRLPFLGEASLIILLHFPDVVGFEELREVMILLLG